MSVKKIKTETAIETATRVAGTDPLTTVGSTEDGGQAVHPPFIGQAITRAMERIAEEFGSFKAGELTISSLADFIDQMVRTVEVFLPGRGQGALKHAELIAAFGVLDKKYGIIDKIDLAIKLPFYLEPVDGPVIRLIVDVLIKGAVTFANKHGW